MATRRLLPVVLLCALAGCGDSGPSDEEQIRATLAAFQQATAERDYAALCDAILAAELVGTLEDVGLPCRDALREGFAGVRAPQIAVGAVTVGDDGTASAQVRSSAAGQQPREDTVRLVREDGGWRIASLADGQGP